MICLTRRARLGRPVEGGAAGVVAVHETLGVPVGAGVELLEAELVRQVLDLPRLPDLAEVHEQRRDCRRESQVMNSIVSRPCTSASVAKGTAGLLPLWSKVELKKRLHHVGHGQRDAARVAAPFELAHEAAADGVEVGHQVADDQVHRQGHVEPLAVLVAVQVQPVADVPIDPAAQVLELLVLVGLLGEHVGQELHVEPGDLEAEGVARRDDVRQGRLHAHRVVPEDDHAPAPQRHGGQAA